MKWSRGKSSPANISWYWLSHAFPIENITNTMHKTLTSSLFKLYPIYTALHAWTPRTLRAGDAVRLKSESQVNTFRTWMSLFLTSAKSIGPVPATLQLAPHAVAQRMRERRAELAMQFSAQSQPSIKSTAQLAKGHPCSKTRAGSASVEVCSRLRSRHAQL